MNMTRIFLLLCFIVVIANIGCHSLRNISANDIRTEKYFYKKFIVAKSIPEIQSSIYTYSKACRPIPELQVDPLSPNKAFISLVAPGLTAGSVIVIMDFSQESPQRITRINTYSYYSTWHRHIENIVQAIIEPNVCQ
jgi:hypothetical protein